MPWGTAGLGPEVELVTQSCLDVLELSYSSVRPGPTPTLSPPNPKASPQGVQDRQALRPAPSSASAPEGSKKEAAGASGVFFHAWDIPAPNCSTGTLCPAARCHRGRLEVLPLTVIPLAAILRAHWVPAPAAPGQPAKNRGLAAGQPRAREAVGSRVGMRGYSQRAAGLFLASQY